MAIVPGDDDSIPSSIENGRLRLFASESDHSLSYQAVADSCNLVSNTTQQSYCKLPEKPVLCYCTSEAKKSLTGNASPSQQICKAAKESELPREAHSPTQLVQLHCTGVELHNTVNSTPRAKSPSALGASVKLPDYCS